MGSANRSTPQQMGNTLACSTLFPVLTHLFRFGRAEGCVAIVIKPLQDALRDHDHIYATVVLIDWFQLVYGIDLCSDPRNRG